MQIENTIKENPDNHIAKSVLEKLAENCPKLENIKSDFQKEYTCVWIGGEDGK